MANFYIEDPNGTYHSEDGSRTFIKLTGAEAYAFLQSAKGRSKRFFRLRGTENSESDTDYDYIEIPPYCINEFRSEEYHEQYLADWRKRSGIFFTSLEQEEAAREDGTGPQHTFPSSSDVHEEVSDKLELQQLYKALASLSSEERYIIQRLFLSDPPASMQEVGHEIGVSHMAIHRRKMMILKKLKNFF